MAYNSIKTQSFRTRDRSFLGMVYYSWVELATIRGKKFHILLLFKWKVYVQFAINVSINNWVIQLGHFLLLEVTTTNLTVSNNCGITTHLCVINSSMLKAQSARVLIHCFNWRVCCAWHPTSHSYYKGDPPCFWRKGEGGG